MKPKTDSDSEIKPATPRSPWRLSDSRFNSPMIDLNMDLEGNVVLHQRVLNNVEMGDPQKITRQNIIHKLLKAGLVKPKLHRLKIHPNKDKKKFLDNVQLTKKQLQTVVIHTSPTYTDMACDPRAMFAGAPRIVRRHFLASPLKKIRRCFALKQKDTLTTEFSYPSSVAMVKKVEKAILPDGTIYQLETTWCKDPDYHIKHTTFILLHRKITTKKKNVKETN